MYFSFLDGMRAAFSSTGDSHGGSTCGRRACHGGCRIGGRGAKMTVPPACSLASSAARDVDLFADKPSNLT